MSEVTLTRFAGIRNTLPPERIQSVPDKSNAAVDLTAALNIDLDDSGQVARRAGQTLKRAGAAHSLWAAGADCLFVAGTELKRLLPDFSAVTLATGLAADASACYVAVNGRIYWSNGAQSGVIDGANRSWGMPIPALAGAMPIAGQMEAGTYQAALTHLRRDGQESGAGLPLQFTLADGQGVRLAWPAPADPDITGVALYLSEPNGMVLYHAGDAAAGALAADVTGPALARPLDTQWLDAPPPGQCLAYHNGRILIAAGEYLYGSAALGYEYCDLRDYLALDGTRIGFVQGVRHGIYLGTAQAVYFAAGDRLDELTLKTVVAAPCVPGSALLADGMAVTGNRELAGREVALFATGAGICLGMDDGSVVNLTQERYQFSARGPGAAHFRDSAQLKQYLLFTPA